ncbi:XRE family transcriptional regulator [Ktedonosporobacter rubrisoli]|uniref:XRE family transcriptional regulator n=1 Tax=Ktedonosporobacter rubrisoli TaxID=2509675 RepID=A0A4P6JN07_KTERU|nr:helix-turn-helix transcriptional regulator [Ktedonosporobacter rubrisoli]QBD76422.1 XRE family transcriptional regulator [Ktedonosporobacter rubrisoli]
MIQLKVKEIAAKRGVSQARLSRLADVDIKVLRKIYRTPTTANITLATLNRLAFALHVDARDLVDYQREDALPGLHEDDIDEEDISEADG